MSSEQPERPIGQIVAELQASCDRLTLANARLDDANMDLRKEIQNTRAELQTNRVFVANARQTEGNLRSEIIALQQKLTAAQAAQPSGADVDAMEKENHKLRTEFDGKRKLYIAAIAKLSVQLANARKERPTMVVPPSAERLRKVRVERAKLREQVARLERDVINASAEMRTLRIVHEQRVAELDNCVAANEQLCKDRLRLAEELAACKRRLANPAAHATSSPVEPGGPWTVNDEARRFAEQLDARIMKQVVDAKAEPRESAVASFNLPPIFTHIYVNGARINIEPPPF